MQGFAAVNRERLIGKLDGKTLLRALLLATASALSAASDLPRAHFLQPSSQADAFCTITRKPSRE
jgi:hypothetical protein